MRKSVYLLVVSVIFVVFLLAVSGCSCTPPAPVVKKEVVLSFDNIYFDVNKDVISDSNKALLQKYAPMFQAMEGKKIAVEGYCDERGSVKYNSALAKKRADAVAKYLVEFGVSQDKLTVAGYGLEKSLAVASKEESWAKSRRVQFVVK